MITGWWFQPLKRFVNWDDDISNMGKKIQMFQTTKQIIMHEMDISGYNRSYPQDLPNSAKRSILPLHRPDTGSSRSRDWVLEGGNPPNLETVKPYGSDSVGRADGETMVKPWAMALFPVGKIISILWDDMGLPMAVQATFWMPTHLHQWYYRKLIADMSLWWFPPSSTNFGAKLSWIFNCLVVSIRKPWEIRYARLHGWIWKVSKALL